MKQAKADSLLKQLFKSDKGMLFVASFYACCFWPMISDAQLNDCNGVWSNKPCDKVSTDKVSQYKSSLDDAAGTDSVSIEENDAGPDANKKQRMVRDLSKEVSDAKRRFGIKTDLELVRSICLEQPTSLETCSRSVNEVGDRLHERIAQAEELALKKKELELKEREQQERGNQSNATSVSIVNVPKHSNVRDMSRESEVYIHGKGGEISVGVREREGTVGRVRNDNDREDRQDIEDYNRQEVDEHPHHNHHGAKERRLKPKMDAPASSIDVGKQSGSIPPGVRPY